MKKQKKTTPLAGEDRPFFSQRKNVVRLILFILAVAVAVTAVGYGVYRIGHRDPGPYTVTAELDESLPYYSAGISFVYHFTGSSGEIKTLTREITGEYTALLKRSFKLMDGENTYPEVVNLASLNQNPGVTQEIPPELYPMLADAWDKTRAGEGYTLLAGPMKYYRRSLIYSFDGAEQDPLADPASAERVAAIAALTGPDSFSLEMDPDTRRVTFRPDPALTDYLDAQGIGCGLLDFDLLYDAYRLQYIAENLEKKGYTAGYLTTDSGLSVSLSGNDPAYYCFYARQGEQTVMAAQIPGQAGTVGILWRTFPYEEGDPGYYSLNGVPRHPYLIHYDPPAAAAALTVTPPDRIAEGCYANLRLLACRDKEAALTLAAGLKTDTVFSLWGEKRVYLPARLGETALVLEEYETQLY